MLAINSYIRIIVNVPQIKKSSTVSHYRETQKGKTDMSVTTITNKVKKVNLYFFGEEVIHWEDATWFYGGSGLALLITTIVCLPI